MNMNISMEDEDVNQVLSEIAPAQFFDAGNKLAGFVVKEMNRGVDGGSGFSIITSQHQRLEATPESLLRLGYISDRSPEPKVRWSQRSITQFLKGGEVSTLADTFSAIVTCLSSYIDMGQRENVETLSLWIMGTYLHRLFSGFGYVHLQGAAESGKTKTLQIVSLLGFNGIMASQATPAALIRITHHNQSTICVDEVERLHHIGKDEAGHALLATLNIGYKKGQLIPKLESGKRENNWILKEFDPYSPKIFAGIHGLETTLASRCISILLMKSDDHAISNREVDPEDECWGELRDRLYGGVLSEWMEIEAIYNSLEDSEIIGRSWETWKPLLSIAKHLDTAHHGLYEGVRNFAIKHSQYKKEILGEESIPPKILSILASFFLLKTEEEIVFVPLQDLSDRLLKSEPDVFKEFLSGKRHLWFTSQWLGSEIRKIGLVQGASLQRKIGGRNMKGYYIQFSTLTRRMKAYGIGYEAPNVGEDGSQSLALVPAID